MVVVKRKAAGKVVAATAVALVRVGGDGGGDGGGGEGGGENGGVGSSMGGEEGGAGTDPERPMPASPLTPALCLAPCARTHAGTHCSFGGRAVELAQPVDKDEHRHRVPPAATIVRQEAVPQRERPLRLCDRADALHRRRVRQLARGGVGLLEGHAVLCALEWHRDERVDQPRRHRRRESVEEATAERRLVQLLELVKRGDLRAADDHGAHDKGLGAAVEGGQALLACDPRDRVHHGRVASSLLHGQRCVIRHAHQADLDWARDERGAAARDGGGGKALGKVCLAVLGQGVAERLKQPVTGRRVEDLAQAACADAGIEAADALSLDHIGREGGEPLKWASTSLCAHRRQIHAHCKCVEWVHAHPSHDAAES
mmetsp:Transcript_2470/g.5205  ORF Transcript_2470/g.5205 Transcript_2470/m.5205 type:complete len:371 (+) Transcript_2470:738-1850(+)